MKGTEEKKTQYEGLAAYVGISAPETPKYLLANNFLLEYFEAPGNGEKVYDYALFEENKTLHTEDEKNRSRLQYSFDLFFGRYLGEEVIREENGRLNEKKHYYFPLTPDMLTGSTMTLRHLLFYLQNIGKKFDYEQMQELLEAYIFRDNEGMNHIIKILLQNQEQKIVRKAAANREECANFWNMLSELERTRMQRLATTLNDDLTTLLRHRYFGKLDFYRRYHYLSVLLTSYVIQYIVVRKGRNSCILCQGAPRDERLEGAFHRAGCRNYAALRAHFSTLLSQFYKEAIRKAVLGADVLKMEIREENVYINEKEFNEFLEGALNSKKKSKLNARDIIRAFELTEHEETEISIDNFVLRYIDLTGSRKGSSLTKISSTLPTCGKQIDMVFPQNRSKQKYFAMSETLAEFYVRLYLARKNQQYDYLDNFIDDLQSRYRIVLVKSREGERMLKSMKITLPAQEYAKNKAVFIDLLTSINCLIKLSDSGYVVTLPEEKGDFKLI